MGTLIGKFLNEKYKGADYDNIVRKVSQNIVMYLMGDRTAALRILANMDGDVKILMSNYQEKAKGDFNKEYNSDFQGLFQDIHKSINKWILK
jgi:hypothetical protein